MLDYGDFSDSAFGLIDEHFCSHKIPCHSGCKVEPINPCQNSC